MLRKYDLYIASSQSELLFFLCAADKDKGQEKRATIAHLCLFKDIISRLYGLAKITVKKMFFKIGFYALPG